MMRVMFLRLSSLLLSLAMISGCSGKQMAPYIENHAAYRQRVFVIDHGMHTGLVLESRDILPGLGLQDSFYGGYRFVEIGRGDAGFYQQADPGWATTLSALFLVTPAVLHMRAYNYEPHRRYPLSRTIEVRLADEGMKSLLDAVAASFFLENGRAVELAEGANERSRFFRAKGSYHLFYTCNNWTADMIERGGYPISHRWAFYADTVMVQLEAVQSALGLPCDAASVTPCEVALGHGERR